MRSLWRAGGAVPQPFAGGPGAHGPRVLAGASCPVRRWARHRAALASDTPACAAVTASACPGRDACAFLTTALGWSPCASARPTGPDAARPCSEVAVPPAGLAGAVQWPHAVPEPWCVWRPRAGPLAWSGRLACPWAGGVPSEASAHTCALPPSSSAVRVTASVAACCVLDPRPCWAQVEPSPGRVCLLDAVPGAEILGPGAVRPPVCVPSEGCHAPQGWRAGRPVPSGRLRFSPHVRGVSDVIPRVP